MSRVLLVNPPFYRVLGSHYNAFSLGMAYVASNLNRNGHDAWLYNADGEKTDYYKKAHKIFEDFPTYVELFKDEAHPIWTETVRSILAFQPDWVGFTAYTSNISAIRIISRQLRAAAPEVRQVVGGAATTDPNLLHHLPDVDLCVHREGEAAMLSLVNGERPEEVCGVSYRKFGMIQGGGPTEFLRPLEDYPFPERDKFWSHQGRPANEEERAFIDVSYMISLRGCPYRCTFCASPVVWTRNNLRYRCPDNVIDEMLEVKKYWRNPVDYSILSQNHKPKEELLADAVRLQDNAVVYFVDDVFTLKKDRCLEIMQKMIDRNVGIPWKCESRADNIDQDIANKMKESGCVRVKMGVESGSERILKIMKKDETKQEILRGVRCLQKAGVAVTAHILTGFPEETDEDLQQTIDFARELGADYNSLSILTPYYGTEVYKEAASNPSIGLDKQPWEYFFTHSKKMMLNSKISEAKLREFWELSNPQNYR